jgi:DNA-binding transcriptional ArsR family regulator
MVALPCTMACMARSDSAGPEAGREREAADVGATEAEESLPLGPQLLPELIEFRRVEDPATMKALADPLRLKIMRTLGRNAPVKPRVMTVKQLAEELGEPTTKLYRHMKQLLAVDLIQVAELRLVGGIVEQHYRVAQKDWGVSPEQFGPDRDPLLSDEMFGIVGAVVDEYFTRYEEALRSGRTYLRSQECLDHPPYVRSVGSIVDHRMSQAKAAEFSERLHALVKEFTDDANKEEDGVVTVNLMLLYYATEAEE